MSDAIDLKEVMERVQDDAELLFELLEIFVEDFEDKRQKLGEAVEAGDVETVQAITHGLKGASGNIAAKAMHEHIKAIEAAAKTGDIAPTKEGLPLLDQQFEDLKVHIEKLKAELGEG